MIICRCEDINEIEIRKAIRQGNISISAVKRRLGAGMGLCQGRVCHRLIASIIAEECGLSMEEAMIPATFRPPTRPLPLDVLGDNTK